MDPKTCDRPCPLRDEGQHWREEAERLTVRVAELEAERTAWQTERTAWQTERTAIQAQLATLQRHVFGKRSEKMPTPKEAIRHADDENGCNGAAAQQKRQEHAKQRANLPERPVHHPVPDSERVCPICSSTNLKPLGEGEVSYEFEYVPSRVVRHRHVREKLVCADCHEGIVTAPPPPKVVEGGQYGPRLMAHLVVEKCADAIPIYRQEKQWRRLGIPLSRSTLTDLFHRVAKLLAPLCARLLQRIREEAVVHADETTQRIQAVGKTLRAWMWTFLAGSLTAYVFAASRSGQTPSKVLGSTTGTLVVDAYSGYNAVTVPGNRTRAGCLAHARRKFFDALPTAPSAQFALDRILEVYRVEHEALERGVAKTAEHLKMRRERAGPAMVALWEWMDREGPKQPPKSPLGQAIGYAQNHWEALTRFLDDAAIPVDNNAAERALRAVAMGRKAFLFVGDEEAGENLAVLYTLVATCEACGVEPEAYLADVLIRIQTHPQSRIDELLPDRWQPLPTPAGPGLADA